MERKSNDTKGPARKAPTAQQLDALRLVKLTYGRTWRSWLGGAWETGNYASCHSVAPLLQQLRNSFGPSWLQRVNITATDALSDAAPPATPVGELAETVKNFLGFAEYHELAKGNMRLQVQLSGLRAALAKVDHS
jgi:hypothetical protein